MMRFTYLSTLILALLLGVVLIPAQAQDGETCPTLVEQVLAAVGDNCGGMARNSVCYGFNRVDATFNTTVDAGFFAQPADTADLVMVQSLQTAPMDTIQNIWGAAVMNIQAVVPNTLPGQAVVFLLLGAADIENAVLPDDMVTPVDPISVEVTTAANIRSGASRNTNVIGSVPAGATVAVDGIHPNGAWYRVVFNEGIGWIHSSVIPAIEGLPVISETSRGAMQAFYFSTGAGESVCNEAPGLVVVQGPDGIQIDLTINGADITLDATIALTGSSNTLQLYVLDGHVNIGGLDIPAGFTINASLDASNSVVPGSWTNTRPMTEADLSIVQSLSQIDSSVLNYTIQPPTQEQIAETVIAISGGTPGTISGRTSGSTLDAVDCEGFVVTSPVGGLPYGTVPFHWNPAVGATQYRLSIYSPTAVGPATTLLVDGSQSSVVIDAASIGGGDRFSWDVTALYEGEDACTTGRASLTRASGPDVVVGGAAPPVPTAVYWELQATGPSGTTLRVQCVGSEYILSWANVLGTLRFEINYGSPPISESFETVNPAPPTGTMPWVESGPVNFFMIQDAVVSGPFTCP